jgi:predicted house-cleaning noncanonical NTP pyrophosphatase (MazG superfamily)
MKTKHIYPTLLLSTLVSFAACKNTDQDATDPLYFAANTPEAAVPTVAPVPITNKIQVALLLDTSNSMDGLIEQAKSRLWNIVNTLTTLKYSGQTPDIQIALYEYGNDGLSQQSNYIRQVAPLTTDLDLISEKLFALSTNGGSEYCGAVIQDATKQLSWGNNEKDMKLVYIAGNEGFNQGGVNYKEAIRDALVKDIYVNTIFCGNPQEGISLMWKDGADFAKGKFFTINSNEAVQYVNTPYDDKISECNVRMNGTYVNYGAQGDVKKQMQVAQDANAGSISTANYTERAVSKSKAVYKNDSWDLVDKVKEDKEAVKKLKKEELPKELQNKTEGEIKAYVQQKATERKAIQDEIATLAKKRQDYINAEAKKNKAGTDLGDAITASIQTLAKQKGYSVEK